MIKKVKMTAPLLLAVALLSAMYFVIAAAPAPTINVNSTADTLVASDNECTLREAINNANTDSDTTAGDCTAGSGADVITLPAGTYTLTIPGADEDNNATGDLDISDSLTINGSGAFSTTINGDQLDRVLHILPASNVMLNGLTVANGYSTLGTLPSGPSGGGIMNEYATLVVNDSILRDNTAQGDVWTCGGGLYNGSGHVTLNNTTILENQVINNDVLRYGGGLCNDAWFDNANLVLNNSQVGGNSASGGGGIFSAAGNNVTATLTISHSVIISNVASYDGGMAGNGDGGGIIVSIYGGVENPKSLFTIYESTIANNQAIGAGIRSASGGGLIVVNGQGLINSSTIMNNTASSSSSSLSGLGGGLAAVSSVVTVANSTISGNTASGDPMADNAGGGLALASELGFTAAYTLVNTTIANNSADEAGGGLWAGEIDGGGDMTVTFVNTLLAGNTAPTGQGANCFASSGPPEFISLGYNLEDDDTCQFDQPDDQINTDPLLGSLQDNGGATWTHALLDFSPAIDAGDDVTCAAPPVNGVDQRRVARPIGSHCDIGAYESSATPPILPITGLTAVNDSPTLLGNSTTLTATVATGESITYTWDFGNGVSDMGAVVTYAYPALGTFTAVVTATNPVSTVTATTIVTITQASYRSYLPLVRNP